MLLLSVEMAQFIETATSEHLLEMLSGWVLQHTTRLKKQAALTSLRLQCICVAIMCRTI